MVADLQIRHMTELTEGRYRPPDSQRHQRTQAPYAGAAYRGDGRGCDARGSTLREVAGDYNRDISNHKRQKTRQTVTDRWACRQPETMSKQKQPCGD